jgi:hypothetical protein
MNQYFYDYFVSGLLSPGAHRINYFSERNTLAQRFPEAVTDN